MLLYKYVIDLHGQEAGEKLIEKYEANLFGKNGLAFLIGSESLAFFCLYFLQDTFRVKPNNTARELAPFQFEIWEMLDSMFIKDEFDKLELVMPRGSSKTTSCDFALTVFCHCYQISKYSLICGKTEQDATEFVRNIRQALEDNPYIIAAFGKLINPKKYTCNSLEIEFCNKTKVQAIGSESSMRGKKFYEHRPSLIIADDYQGKKDVITQEARDKKFQVWEEDCKFAGDKAVFRNGKKIKPATKFIVLGTILHRDCFMSRLLKDNTYKHILKRVMDVEDVDKYFNSGLWAEFKSILTNPKDTHATENAREFFYQNEDDMTFKTLWDDKYNSLDLAINDYYPNPQSFKQEYQNDASKIGEKAFHNLKTMSKEQIEDNSFSSPTILCCDPAVEIKLNNDYTALLVGSKTSNNFRWVRKGIIEKYSFDDYIDKVIKLLQDYEDISAIWIEKNTFNGTDAREIKKRISEDDTLRHRKIEVINERQNKNKEAKIRAISGKVDSGFIIFNDEDQAFNQQILDYEGEVYSLHDDAPDITAEFDRLIDEIQVNIKLKTLPLSYLGL